MIKPHTHNDDFSHRDNDKRQPCRSSGWVLRARRACAATSSIMNPMSLPK